MSIDNLQNSIRKLKNPSMVLFSLNKEYIPTAYLEAASNISTAYCTYARQLLTALKGIVPAVRFSFGSFALYGEKGLEILRQLLDQCAEDGFYVLLDMPEIYTPEDAAISAELSECEWPCDGVLVSSYLGTDVVKPFAERMKDNEMDLFVCLRSANKSASELQDLLTGSRLVYAAAADIFQRIGDSLMGKSGYSRIAGVGPATSTDAIRKLRSKNDRLFLLIDGYDYSGANAKNCSYAFDNIGHGAVACAGKSIVAAWKDNAFADPVVAAVEAAERMQKNLTRYISIL